MFKNYFRIAWRNLKKNRLLSSLNIFGLATGFACCLLMTLYITDELSYDNFNKDGDRVYRVVKDFVNEDGSRLPDATTPPAIAPAIMKEIPGVESVIRIFPDWGRKHQVKYGEKEFYEPAVYHADPNVFSFFTFPLVKGNPATALSEKTLLCLRNLQQKNILAQRTPLVKQLR